MPGTFVQLKKIPVTPFLFEPIKPGLYVSTNIQSQILSPQTYDIPTSFIDLTAIFFKKPRLSAGTSG
jgi:hypothetical protein